jgi:hypothetical protein
MRGKLLPGEPTEFQGEFAFKMELDYRPRRLRSMQSLQRGFPPVPLRRYFHSMLVPVRHLVLLWWKLDSIECHGFVVGIMASPRRTGNPLYHVEHSRYSWAVKS